MKRPVGQQKSAGINRRLKMVDPSRFEPAEGQSDVQHQETYISDMSANSTPQSTPAGKSDEINALRLQLTDADRRRRELLERLFLSYPGEIQPMIKILFSDAASATLEKIERILTTTETT